MNYSQQIGCSEKYVGEGMAVVFNLLRLEKLNLPLVNSDRKVCSCLILPLIHLLKPFMSRELCYFIHSCLIFMPYARSFSEVPFNTGNQRKWDAIFVLVLFMSLFLWFPFPPTTQTKHAQNLTPLIITKWI